MRSWAIRASFLATALVLAGCDDGATVTSLPTPPTQSSPPSLIPAATTSQEFSVLGETVIDGSGPTIDPSVQIKVRYDAPSQKYEVFLPDALDWKPLFDEILSTYQVGDHSALLATQTTGYQYSQLISWADGANGGIDAIGIATPTAGVPVTGTARYTGQIFGLTSEHHAQSSVGGSISLSFDFGAGSLAGSITPDLGQGYEYGTINFRDTVYSTGSTGFSGSFDTDAAGVNSFSGLFTGPKAEELIGNFAFPYRSPIDQLTYQVDGAFVGKR